MPLYEFSNPDIRIVFCFLVALFSLRYERGGYMSAMFFLACCLVQEDGYVFLLIMVLSIGHLHHSLR